MNYLELLNMCWLRTHFPGNRSGLIILPLLAVLLLWGCHPEHYQSAVHPRGPGAGSIATLWWFLLAVCTAVFIVTMALLVWALAAPRRGEAPLGNTFIIVAGIVVPAFILVGIMIYSLEATVALRMPQTRLTVQVIGHQWWWEVVYPEHDIVTANEIHIPVGAPVRLELRARDVVHSFWVPNLTGKMDLVPEHDNFFWMQADEPGIYRGQCAEFCGPQHAWMAFKVVALPEEEFKKWLIAKQRPHPELLTPELRRGHEVFFEAGCNACHAIRGAGAVARAGPDLTHIATRLTIGAGLLPNTRGALSDWIVNSQAVKPGNLMPPTRISPEDLHALVNYLLLLD